MSEKFDDKFARYLSYKSQYDQLKQKESQVLNVSPLFFANLFLI